MIGILHKRFRRWSLVAGLAVVATWVSVSRAAPMGTGFTYQGQLKKGGVPVPGPTCNFVFSLWDHATDPNVTHRLGSQSSPGLQVINGLFTANLDFGDGKFNGQGRWLEINFQCPGDAGSTTLTPRQTLTPVPHALALPGLYTQQNATSPNIIGGYSGNAMTTGVIGATIAGGGSTGTSTNNRVTDNYGTIGGGQGNQAGDGLGSTADRLYATVCGGANNIASGYSSTVSGGEGNTVSNYYSFVGGGRDNTASGVASSVGGGADNVAGRVCSGGTHDGLPCVSSSDCVGGGICPDLGSGQSSTVAGGNRNSASATGSAVGGGEDNRAMGRWSTIPGGTLNKAGGDYSFAAGQRAKVDHAGTFVWSDSTTLFPSYFTSTGPNQFLIMASGGVGIGTNAPTENLHIYSDHATVKLQDDDEPGSATRIIDAYPSQLRIDKSRAAGETLIDINPITLDGTSEADFRVFRSTNTTGPKFAYFHRGNDTSEASAAIGVDGWNSYFQANGGNVGIGTTEPASKLHIMADSGASGYRQGVSIETPAGGGFQVYPEDTTANPQWVIHTYANEDMVFDIGDAERLRIDGTTGNVGIGMTPAAGYKLDVLGDARFGSGNGRVAVGSDGNAHIELRQMVIENPQKTPFIDFSNDPNIDYDARIILVNDDTLAVVGATFSVPALEIRGADVAEKFPVSEEVKPGMVVEIDPDKPGQLRLSQGAYNRRVAGVVSGANGLSAGAILGNLPGHEDAPPIALSGRVWVHCDTSNGAIQPGDLLTTSDAPGYAMKVTDSARAQGAVLGKAMTALSEGNGLVLVLVSLQ